MENESGEKTCQSRTVRCILLFPSGGEVPEDLFTALRRWEVSVTTVASPASLMAELGLCEIEFRHRRAAASSFTGKNLETDNQNGESTDWRDPLIMLVADPDRVPDLPILIRAVARYYPQVLRWKYDLNAKSKFGPLPSPTDIQEQPTEQQQQPITSPEPPPSHHEPPDPVIEDIEDHAEESDPQPGHLRLTWSQDENEKSETESPTIPQEIANESNEEESESPIKPPSDVKSYFENTESQPSTLNDDEPKTSIHYLPKTDSKVATDDHFDQDNEEEEIDEDIASVTQAELAMLLGQDDHNSHEEKES